jgi:hypothetical protein
MMYKGRLLLGVDDNAKIEKLYTVAFSAKNKKTVFGEKAHETIEGAVSEARETGVIFETANIYENVFADKTLVFSEVVKTAYKAA